MNAEAKVSRAVRAHRKVLRALAETRTGLPSDTPEPAALAGRQRIIERHRPREGENWDILAPVCDYCTQGEAALRWPCVDYRDAAADLLPETDTD